MVSRRGNDNRALPADPRDRVTMLKSEHLRVNVTPETRAQLKSRAEREDRTVAYIIRKAISAYLKGTP